VPGSPLGQLIDSAEIINGTIRGKDIHRATIGAQDIKGGAVNSFHVENGSLTSQDLKSIPGIRLDTPTNAGECFAGESTRPQVFDAQADELYFVGEPYDPANLHTNGCGGFIPGFASRLYATVPATGFYAVGAGVTWQDSGSTGSRSVRVLVNGVDTLAKDTEADVGAVDETMSAVETVRLLSAGSHLSVEAGQNSGGALYIGSGYLYVQPYILGL
jgi:hypothetical protein